MKASQRNQRRRPSQTGPGISLFPFLAVLICTMGALVPLLLAISRTARIQAEAAALAKAAEQNADLQVQQEDVQWRIEQLKRSRQQTESQLSDARLQLGHLEDHSRRLRDQLAQYEKTIGDFEKLENADQQQRAQAETELEQVRSQIGVAQRQLGEARQAASGRNRSYAVVPYEGPSQTHRRPIYLECRTDAIVLQPEGIALSDADFEGPLGPSNPLAAALRAAREYLLSQRDFDPQVGEPYPMLLVRPEGINAYYAARAAMKSWGGDFGYELIGDDWKLAYPPPDRRLAEVVQQVVASARTTQARLAAAAPRHYNSRTKAVYRAAPGRGGFVREGGWPDDDDRDYTTADTAGPIGRNEGGASGEGAAARGGGGSYPALASAQGGNDGVPGNPYASLGQEPGYGTPGNPFRWPAETSATGGTGTGGIGVGGTGTGGTGMGVGSFATPPCAIASANAPSRGEGPSLYAAGPTGEGTAATAVSSPPNGGGTQGRSAAAGKQQTELPDGYVIGQEHEPSSPSPRPSATAAHGQPLRPGEWEPTPDPPPRRADDQLDDKHDGRHGKSLAAKRGADWGLRDSARGSVGVTRPIRIECYADRLVVVSERDPAASKVIALGPRADRSIDALISAVWEHMETWGIAGRGMYWRPLLQVQVAPDAERRFAELSALLEGSGLMVTRK